MNKTVSIFLLSSIAALSACAFAAPSRVNQSFYTEILSMSFSPNKSVEMEKCIYFAFFDNRFGEAQVRREETRTGKRVNMQIGTYDLVSADVNNDGSFKIFKYYSAPSVGWVTRVVSAGQACAEQSSK